MAQKKQMPEVAYIGHPSIRRKHRHVVFIIDERYPDGTPYKCRVLYNEQTVDVSRPENRDFMTGYIPAEMIEREGKEGDEE